jgi:hypothetical protein
MISSVASALCLALLAAPPPPHQVRLQVASKIVALPKLTSGVGGAAYNASLKRFNAQLAARLQEDLHHCWSFEGADPSGPPPQARTLMIEIGPKNDRADSDVTAVVQLQSPYGSVPIAEEKLWDAANVQALWLSGLDEALDGFVYQFDRAVKGEKHDAYLLKLCKEVPLATGVARHLPDEGRAVLPLTFEVSTAYAFSVFRIECKDKSGGTCALVAKGESYSPEAQGAMRPTWPLAVRYLEFCLPGGARKPYATGPDVKDLQTLLVFLELPLVPYYDPNMDDQ